MRLYKKLLAKIGLYFIISAIILFLTCIYTAWSLPRDLVLVEGEEYIYNVQSVFPVKLNFDKEETVQLGRNQVKPKRKLQFSNSVLLKTLNKGSANLEIKLFGVIPLKLVKVNVVPNNKVVACGNTVGVKLKLDGILVIGMGEVEAAGGYRVSPIKDTGIKPGDFILQVNRKIVNDISSLIEEINASEGKEMHLRYRSGDSFHDVQINPVKSIDDNNYHIGLWVRDNTAGIGTLTFYDPETTYFGALGHGITDMDTGILIPVKWGEIIESNILAIKKGENGVPGELKGIFAEDGDKLGSVTVNSSYGIYGQLYGSAISEVPGKTYPIAVRSQIREGPATIIANIMGREVEEYSIEIQKVSMKSVKGSKGMVIKITDERLLEATGGIVQGMSGSPIVQDGRIVGAVTHVLVNDPSRGYGIFIESMIKEMYENSIVQNIKANAS
ncbi:MAG TPA: SpoIVB peptidase [Clostridiales bacterium]|nr:SpoIVB peptidase [Clostridiales bacterium]